MPFPVTGPQIEEHEGKAHAPGHSMGCIEETIRDPVIPVPSSDTKKGKHRLNSFNIRYD